jgi:cytosine permease
MSISQMHQEDPPLSQQQSETTHLNEYENTPVPQSARKSLFSVSAVWLGFPMIMTCAIFGGLIVHSLGFVQGMLAIAIGSAILMAYVGGLSYIAGRSGKSFALTAVETFGAKGFRAVAGLLSTLVIGWFAFQTAMVGVVLNTTLGWSEQLLTLVAGVLFVGLTLVGIRALTFIGLVAAPLYIVLGIVAIVIAAAQTTASPWDFQGSSAGTLGMGAAITLVVASFIDSGTMTADFTRWSKNGKEGFLATLAAFPFGIGIAMVIGGVIVALGANATPGTDGGNFLGVLVEAGGLLTPLAVVFVLVNLGSVCAHCLYNGAVGWANLTGHKMRTLALVLGAIGVAAAVAGIWTLFEQWLNLLGVIVPPIGVIIILDQLVLKRRERTTRSYRASAFIAWGIAAAAALVVHFFVPVLSDAVVAMVVAAIVYWALSARRTSGEIKVSSAARSS